eukprot:823111-Prorocentrum_minimum.AAC.1
MSRPKRPSKDPGQLPSFLSRLWGNKESDAGLKKEEELPEKEGDRLPALVRSSKFRPSVCKEGIESLVASLMTGVGINYDGLEEQTSPRMPSPEQVEAESPTYNPIPPNKPRPGAHATLRPHLQVSKPTEDAPKANVFISLTASFRDRANRMSEILGRGVAETSAPKENAKPKANAFAGFTASFRDRANRMREILGRGGGEEETWESTGVRTGEH